MLGAAGFEQGPVFVATCLIAAFGSLLMGLWAKLPMAIGCAISLTAFTAFSLVLGQGLSIPVALGAIFLITMPQLISLGKDLLPAAIGQAPGLQAVIYGAVLIAFVMFEPMGLYGRWLKVRTWFQLFPFYRKGMFKRQKSFQKSDRLK